MPIQHILHQNISKPHCRFGMADRNLLVQSWLNGSGNGRRSANCCIPLVQQRMAAAWQSKCDMSEFALFAAVLQQFVLHRFLVKWGWLYCEGSGVLCAGQASSGGPGAG